MKPSRSIKENFRLLAFADTYISTLHLQKKSYIKDFLLVLYAYRHFKLSSHI